MNYSKISDNKFEFNRKPSVGVVVVVYVSEIFFDEIWTNVYN